MLSQSGIGDARWLAAKACATDLPAAPVIRCRAAAYRGWLL